jgi:hypothetical protein
MDKRLNPSFKLNCIDMVDLLLYGIYLSLSEEPPSTMVPVFNIGHAPFFKPPKECVPAYADHPADFASPVVGLTI